MEGKDAAMFKQLIDILKSQRKAASALGISQALLSHYENGIREPGLGQIVGRGPDGTPAAALAQQVKEQRDGIDQQLSTGERVNRIYDSRKEK